MRCLTDVEIQELADGEGRTELGAHVNDCARCARRLDERRRLLATLTAAVAPTDMPSPALASRVHHAVQAHARLARGSTVLRPSRTTTRRPPWASAIAATAAAVFIAFVVMPEVDAPDTLSAAEIIDRSLEQMTGGSGVETLEYELVLTAAYRQFAGPSEGPYRIVQVFDRSDPARFTFAQYDRDDVLVAATAQDPAQGRRTEMRRVDGRNYIVHVTSIPAPMLPLPQLLQSQAEAVLRLMRLNADPYLTIVEDPDGTHYVIELPGSLEPPAGAPLALNRARVDIDGRDFRVREFSGSGTLLGLPFEVSVRLIAQTRSASVEPSEWEIAQGPGDVVIAGDAPGEFTDSMAVVLRELGRMQGW
jgi:hypothetical protein